MFSPWHVQRHFLCLVLVLGKVVQQEGNESLVSANAPEWDFPILVSCFECLQPTLVQWRVRKHEVPHALSMNRDMYWLR